MYRACVRRVYLSTERSSSVVIPAMQYLGVRCVRTLDGIISTADTALFGY
jgi:hypothetical protein